MLIVGPTGGGATGTSVVFRTLKREGAYLIDADRITRELVQPQIFIWKE